jgi:HEAT repeat protein
MPRRTDEEQAEFERALKAVAAEEPLSTENLDSMSVLEAADLEAFGTVMRGLPAAARARLIRGLRTAAEQRLRLDFSGPNHLALDDEDEAVRLAGVESALEDSSPRLLRRLLELVRSDPSRAVRQAAAEDLSRFALLAELDSLDDSSGGQVRARLLEVVRDEAEDQRVRSAALAALGYFSDDVAAEQLGVAFTSPELRHGAVRGMGRSADPRWSDRLMPVLGSEDPRMRIEAARALAEIEDERAVAPLVEMVDDPERDVRMAVIQALGAIGGEQAREALLYLLQDPEDGIREAAEAMLSAMEEQEELEL